MKKLLGLFLICSAITGYAQDSSVTIAASPVDVPVVPVQEILPAQTLQQVQSSQAAVINAAYNGAAYGNIQFATSSGVTEVFGADSDSIQRLSSLLIAFESNPSALPSAFYWVAVDGNKVIFTYHDLQGLSLALGLRGVIAYGNLQDRLAAIASAIDIASVLAVVW